VRELNMGKLDQFHTYIIDLSSYNLELFTLKWSGGDFKWGSATSEQIPNLESVEISDEIGLEQEELSSELFSFDSKEFLFIKPSETIENLRVHLINPSDSSRTSSQAFASSNYNSGPKYSSLNIIPREVWSGDVNINDPRIKEEGGRLTWIPYYYTINKIVVHHTATPNNQDPIYWMKAIYNNHAYSQGWGDIGYNYLIDQYGNIYEGKLGGDEAKGYHAGSANANSIGISVIGTYSYETPSYAAQDALKRLIAEKSAFYDFTPSWHSTVYGHRDFAATACPGNAFYSVLPDLTSNASTYKNQHFSTIKSVVNQVNDGIDDGEYTEFELILEFNSSVTTQTLASIIPFYDNQPVAWTGIDSFTMEGDTAKLFLNYVPYETQSTQSRLRTLYKVFWLRSEVKAAGLNYEYTVDL
jgi:hypothetical protein